MNSKLAYQLCSFILAYSLLSVQPIKSAGTLLRSSSFEGQAEASSPMQEQFISASGDGEYDTVLELITDVDINCQDSNGLTPIMAAASNGHALIVDLLLQQPKIDLNIQDQMGWTALIYAIMNGHTDITEILLKQENINIELADKTGQTCIDYTMLSDEKPKILELIRRKVDQLIVNAVLNEQLGQAKKLHILLVQKFLNNGDTIVHWGVRNGDLALLKIMFAKDPSLIEFASEKNKNGEMPLIMSKSNSTMSLWLISKKIEREIFLGHIQNAEFLHSALAAKLVKNGDTIVHWAVRNGNLNILKMLLAKNPRLIELVDKVNALGETPLTLAQTNPAIFFFFIELANGGNLFEGSVDEFFHKLIQAEVAQQEKQLQDLSKNPRIREERKESAKLECAVCKRESHGQRCSKCHTRYYCSTACQKKDWATHKHVCSKKS